MIGVSTDFNTFKASFLKFDRANYHDKWLVSHKYWDDTKWRSLRARAPYAIGFTPLSSEDQVYSPNSLFCIYMAYHKMNNPAWVDQYGYVLPLSLSSRFELKGPAIHFMTTIPKVQIADLADLS